MENKNEGANDSFEKITGISEERMKELGIMVRQAEKETEKFNDVPLDASSEKYILDRYPIRVLFDRSEIQEIAMNDHDAFLSEEEIEAASYEFLDEFPHEVFVAISEAIESVLVDREKKTSE